MSETNPPSTAQSNSYTLFFMVVLSLICAFILSILASALKEPQEEAKELDRSKQMLISARILSPQGYFQVQDKEGKFVPAIIKENYLEPSKEIIFPNREEILTIYRNRIIPFLVNDKGQVESFEKAGIDLKNYTKEHRKTGYYKQSLKLVYEILPNRVKQEKESKKELPVEGYVFPINGMGLWDAIYGYLAIKTDGDTVIGISWYDQKETPGLGANIAEADWQSQFPGKKIFQQSTNGMTDFEAAPLGIVVVKGKVNEVLGNSPKAMSAVDGMAGATLTGNGVTNAYRDVLASYRPFLINLQEKNKPTKK